MERPNMVPKLTARPHVSVKVGDLKITLNLGGRRLKSTNAETTSSWLSSQGELASGRYRIATTPWTMSTLGEAGVGTLRSIRS